MLQETNFREGFIEQWKMYGFAPEQLSDLIISGRITSKNVFSNFLHWYLDGNIMFAEYFDLKSAEYQYIRYRKEIDWRD